jgi:hypothetical protein
LAPSADGALQLLQWSQQLRNTDAFDFAFPLSFLLVRDYIIMRLFNEDRCSAMLLHSSLSDIVLGLVDCGSCHPEWISVSILHQSQHATEYSL